MGCGSKRTKKSTPKKKRQCIIKKAPDWHRQVLLFVNNLYLCEVINNYLDQIGGH